MKAPLILKRKILTIRKKIESISNNHKELENRELIAFHLVA